jgi:hypothetical protein
VFERWVPACPLEYRRGNADCQNPDCRDRRLLAGNSLLRSDPQVVHPESPPVQELPTTTDRL